MHPGADSVKDCVNDITRLSPARPASLRGRWQKRLYQDLLGVREVAWIGSGAHAPFQAQRDLSDCF